MVDRGEILIPFGEFLENNHVLMPGAFGLDWYHEEMVHAGVRPPEDLDEMAFQDALDLGRKHKLPLHPRYNLFWHDLTVEEILSLRDFVEKKGRVDGEVLTLPTAQRIK